MYTCWRCKGETPNRRLEYLSEKYPEKYPERYISTCDKCSDELVEEDEFENKQCDSDIVCPACLKSFQPDDGYGYDADGEEVQCEYCGEWYSLTAEHSVEFITKRIRK
jgi:DNA-directed RNA polymerase subunit RPC12/RpoP